MNASEEFRNAVTELWDDKILIILLTIDELERHATELPFFKEEDMEKLTQIADRMGIRIVELLKISENPEAYIAAVEAEFLNPTFN